MPLFLGCCNGGNSFVVQEELTTMSTDDVLGQLTNQIAATTASIPVVGSITKVASVIVGLFTKAHAAALAREASTINNALPTWLTLNVQTINAANAGQIDAAQTLDYLGQAQQIYYTTVAGIIKKGGECDATCIGPTGDYVNKAKGGCCNTSKTCNAACCIGCDIIEPTTRNLSRIVNAGGGTYVIPATQQNGQIKGTPATPVTYSPAALGGLVPASLAKLVPSAVKQHPLIFAAVAVFAFAGYVEFSK